MKILHLCLASFYIDGFSYQENLLPRFHKALGHQVEILASLDSFDSSGYKIVEKKRPPYFNEDGIKVTRLEYKREKVDKKLKRFEGVYEQLVSAKPDLIFMHGCQFLDIFEVARYLKKKSDVELYVDNHADFSNSARSFLSRNVLHRLIWRLCARSILPYANKFFGVLPARVDFLKDVYKIPDEKVDLLLMGADDDCVNQWSPESKRAQARRELHIAPDEFVVVTGGKIDSEKKQVLALMKAIGDLKDRNIRLVVFGSVVDELKEEFESLCQEASKVEYVGWISSSETYQYFAMSDLVVFPGRHSVLWEQVVAQGIPLVVKYWKGTTHVDIGGNVVFLETGNLSEIKEVVSKCVDDKEYYFSLKASAQSAMREEFLYSKIALKSIGCES
ncbi:glycosyltransferase family 4 protein [Halomonas koreensis]|uniref:Glycosyltransferase family 4 protein n=1 Tax=Halomonas koreensis TaxID=245385 RepID=A0ABU1FZ91_9GAMM|nr:glycosyltransferase family 4 protein [Halomonas koreensis]MDR5865944.1 glycosyltransferase family 4 protein [Halomonas koreensis]